MHNLWALSLLQTPLPLQTLGSNNYTTVKLVFSSSSSVIRRKNTNLWRVSAMEQEPNSFEVDQEKARKALNELDLQFESLSNKQTKPSKIQASTLESLEDMKVRPREEPPEISGSFLGSLAFGLFFVSIFYNILFITVIKPSIDGPDDVGVANVTTSTEASTERQP